LPGRVIPTILARARAARKKTPRRVLSGAVSGSSSRLMTPAMYLIAATLFLGALVPNLFVLAPSYLARGGFDARQIGIIMGGFNLAALVSMPVSGRLAERLGHRSVLVGGCLVAAVGALLFDAAGTTATYAGARAVQGLGFAAVLVTAAAYVAEIAPPGRLAQALGISGVLTLASQAVGPAVGELLEHLAGWDWVFRAGAVAGAAGAAVASLLPRADAGDGDAPPGGLSAWPILLATALAGFGFGAVWSFLSDYTDRVGIGQVTPFFAPYVAAAISTRVLFGHLADSLGYRRVAVPALLAHAAALVAMSAVGEAWHLVAIGALFGLAHGFYYPILQAMVIERAGVARSRAIAGSTTAFGFGIVVSAFGLGAMAKVTGYSPIYYVAATAGLVGAGVVASRS
jgi:MFS family permease